MEISVVGSICPVQGWWGVEASVLHIYCGCCMCNVCNQHTPFVCFGILAGSFNLLQSGLHCCGHCAFNSRWYIFSHPFEGLTDLFTEDLNCRLHWGDWVLRRWCYCLQIHYLVLWILLFLWSFIKHGQCHFTAPAQSCCIFFVSSWKTVSLPYL